MISIIVEAENGSHAEIKITDTEDQSLMDILSVQDFGMLASCGGLALCGTCHVKFIKGGDVLPQPENDELQMLDMLPAADKQSRLSCQVKLSDALDGAVIKVMPID